MRYVCCAVTAVSSQFTASSFECHRPTCPAYSTRIRRDARHTNAEGSSNHFTPTYRPHIAPVAASKDSTGRRSPTAESRSPVFGGGWWWRMTSLGAVIPGAHLDPITGSACPSAPYPPFCGSRLGRDWLLGLNGARRTGTSERDGMAMRLI